MLWWPVAFLWYILIFLPRKCWFIKLNQIHGSETVCWFICSRDILFDLLLWLIPKRWKYKTIGLALSNKVNIFFCWMNVDDADCKERLQHKFIYLEILFSSLLVSYYPRVFINFHFCKLKSSPVDGFHTSNI